jgi:hypothetical protein
LLAGGDVVVPPGAPKLCRPVPSLVEGKCIDDATTVGVASAAGRPVSVLKAGLAMYESPELPVDRARRARSR